MEKFRFKTKQQIDKPIQDIFPFFSKVENLEILTPDWLNFKILTPLPIEIKTGTIIKYRIRLYGIPLYWKTKITLWDPPHRFIDEQIKGPYSVWIHEHRFEAKDGKTTMIDTVDYDIPGWIFKTVVHRIFVEKQVDSIFKFRQKKIKEHFSG